MFNWWGVYAKLSIVLHCFRQLSYTTQPPMDHYSLSLSLSISWLLSIFCRNHANVTQNNNLLITSISPKHKGASALSYIPSDCAHQNSQWLIIWFVFCALASSLHSYLPCMSGSMSHEHQKEIVYQNSCTLSFYGCDPLSICWTFFFCFSCSFGLHLLSSPFLVRTHKSIWLCPIQYYFIPLLCALAKFECDHELRARGCGSVCVCGTLEEVNGAQFGPN